MSVDKQEKSYESHLHDLLKKMMYAGIKDLDARSNKLSTRTPMLHEHYDNFIKAKTDESKSAHLEGLFTISTAAKQHLVALLRAVGREIEPCDIPNEADLPTIIKTLYEEHNALSILAKFFEFPAQQLGKTILSFTDETNWLHTQIIGLLPGMKTKLRLIATITEAFDRSLRALAWWLSSAVWFRVEKVVTSEMLLFALYQCNMDLDVLQGIEENVRVVVKKPRAIKKSTVAAAVVSANESVSSNTPTGESASSHAPADVPSTPSSAEAVPGSESANELDKATAAAIADALQQL